MRKPQGHTRLQQIMTERKISHQELATKIPLSRSYVTQIADGSRRPSLNTAQKIASALNVSIDYLFFSQEVGITR